MEFFSENLETERLIIKMDESSDAIQEIYMKPNINLLAFYCSGINFTNSNNEY